MEAQVVGPALHVADMQLAQQRFEERNVPEVKLILQGFGSRGNDDTVPGAQGRQQGRREFLPVPVPASTIKWRRSVRARSTAFAISNWPGRYS